MKNLEETIKLLNHIHENPQSTQRELVEELNVSLGKVNFLIQSLAEKGLIKLKRFKNAKNKKGYLYLITPQGIMEKTKITKDFLVRKLEEYDRVQKEIQILKESIYSSEISKKTEN